MILSLMDRIFLALMEPERIQRNLRLVEKISSVISQVTALIHRLEERMFFWMMSNKSLFFTDEPCNINIKCFCYDNKLEICYQSLTCFDTAD